MSAWFDSGGVMTGAEWSEVGSISPHVDEGELLKA